MFKHQHPYPPYLPKNVTKLIVGTLPPPRFTTRELKVGDIDFCYGSRDGQLWIILSRIFHFQLEFEDTKKAIRQRKTFLKEQGIGICDMVEYAYRKKMDASDLGIQDAHLRPLISIIKKYSRIHTLLFTGGNSKNGPEYFFRQHLKEYPGIELKLINNNVPRIHEFQIGTRKIKTVSLTAPSGSANRAIGSMDAYKKLKDQNPTFDTLDFRVLQYTPFFQN